MFFSFSPWIFHKDHVICQQLRKCRSALLATPQRSCYGWLARTNKGVLHIMFSENLKTLKKQKGFSQKELAGRLHVVRQTISKWEKNRVLNSFDFLIYPSRSHKA